MDFGLSKPAAGQVRAAGANTPFSRILVGLSTSRGALSCFSLKDLHH